jgi:hypothetical protein
MPTNRKDIYEYDKIFSRTLERLELERNICDENKQNIQKFVEIDRSIRRCNPRFLHPPALSADRTHQSNHRLKRAEKSLGDRGYQFCDLADPTKLTYRMLQAHSANIAQTRLFPQTHNVKRCIFHAVSHVFPRILHTRRLETTHQSR